MFQLCCDVLCFCFLFQWDDDLPTDQFSIGYLDRFVGIIEKPFAAFSWEDLASVDSRTVLAVPKHRFQFIKYRDEIVWDKRVQLDNFFGSRGDGTTIADVLDRHAAKVKKETAAAAGRAASSALTSSQARFAFEDEDEDGDDVEGGASQQQNASHRPGPLRPNFFVGIRVVDPDIVAAAAQVQDTIIAGDPRLKDGVLPPTALHVTICMLRISTPKDAERVKAVLERHQRHFMALFSASKLRINGVGNFRGRVVFGRVELTPTLQRVNAGLLQSFRNAGLQTPGNHEVFSPHMTLVKLSRPMCRAMGKSAFVEPALYSEFVDMDFGEQVVPELHVCSMLEPKEADGFYVRLVCMPLGLEILVPSLAPALLSRIRQLEQHDSISAATATELAACLDAGSSVNHARLVSSLSKFGNSNAMSAGWRFFPCPSNSGPSVDNYLGCVYILRGLPGSGKSYLTAKLCEKLSSAGPLKVCSADEYFTSQGSEGDEEDLGTDVNGSDGAPGYDFDVAKIRQAHSYCMDVFIEALNNGMPSVVVDNTNIERWHYARYLQLAAACGYRVVVAHMACRDPETARRFAERCQHSVPLPAVLAMREAWEEEPGSIAIEPIFQPGVELNIDPLLSKSSGVQSELPRLVYSAVFLSQKSCRHLYNAYPAAHPDQVPCDTHCTVQFMPEVADVLALPLGRTVTMRVLGCADDGLNQAVRVAIEGGQVRSDNLYPHITLSYSNKSSAKHSNEVMAEWATSGKPLDKRGDVLLHGTLACMVASPPHDKLCIVTDVSHLQRILSGESRMAAAMPSVLNETGEEEKRVETLYVYDFDGTLANTQGPVEGRILYEKLTGTAWPFSSWLGVPLSLQPPLPVGPGPKMRSFRGHKGYPHSKLVVLTGRQEESMFEPVAEVLRTFDVVPDQLICQPYASPITAEYKEDALRHLIGEAPLLKRVVVYDDLPDNLSMFESLAKQRPELDWAVVDASTHIAAAKHCKNPLKEFVQQYGSLAGDNFRQAVAASLDYLTNAWACVLSAAGSVSVDCQAAKRLVVPFGSVVLGRSSDLDVCLVASSALGVAHKEMMVQLADYLEQCGLRYVHRGFSSRCPRLRCAIPLSSHAPVQVDVVFAMLPVPAYEQLLAGKSVEIANAFRAIPSSDPVSRTAFGGPLFAEEVLSVVESKCSVKTFATALEAIVLLVRGHNIKSNAFHFPRTFHYAKLLAQFVASASADQLASATKLFSLFVRQAAEMGKAKWVKLCREFVPEVYFPRLTETLIGTREILKRPQDVTLDTFSTLFRPEEPHLSLVTSGFKAKFEVRCPDGKVPSATSLWRAGILLEARCGSYVRSLLDKGFLFQPDCRADIGHLFPDASANVLPLLSFAVSCSNTQLRPRDVLQKEFSSMLAEITAVFPAKHEVILSFPE